MDKTTIITIIISSVVIPSIPFLFFAVYRANQIPVLWKRIEALSKDKAEDIDMKMMDGRLRKVEIDFAEKMGRLTGVIDRLEVTEKKFEDIIKSINEGNIYGIKIKKNTTTRTGKI